MSFGVGDGFFKGSGCDGFVTCHGAMGESCRVFPCPPFDGVYAGWWTSGCGITPAATFYLHYWTGTRWQILSEHTPARYEGYVWVRWAMSQGNCGYAYKITFVNEERFFVVGDVPAHRLPCEMWTAEMIKIEKTRLNLLIDEEKEDATADVKSIRADATSDVKQIREVANADIASERAEYKENAKAIRDKADRDIVDVRDLHNEYEARIKVEYTAAKASSDAIERNEKAEIGSIEKVDIAEEKRKETDDIGNVRVQRDLDVAAEYQQKDIDVAARYAERDRRVQEIKDSGKPCVIF